MNLTDLKWTCRCPWDGVFENITPDQEEFLLCELNLDSTETRKAALSRIIWILDGYKPWVGIKSEVIHESSRANNASKALKEAASSLNELGPLAKARFMREYVGDWDGKFDCDAQMSDIPGLLSCLSNLFADFADERRQGRGRPIDEGLDKAVLDLAILYEEATGRPAGFSAPQAKVPGTPNPKQHGPFVRFCQNVISVVSPTETSTVENAVRKFVSQVRKPREST